MKKSAAIEAAAKPALVPKLRFPEFREAEGWEQKEVGDVFQVTRGNVLSMTLVWDEKTDAMPYPVYSSQTKHNGLSGYYSDHLFEDAITWTTDGANAGDVNFRTGKFFCTNVCGVLLNSKGFANPCIAALINRVSAKYVSYVGNPKLMNGVMSKIPIPFPSIAEQKKIAECLSSVDELIGAESRKLDALKSHKKGLMQQLFPGAPTSSSAGKKNAGGDAGAPSETQPRLRFPEFQDAPEWQDEEVGELVSTITPPKKIQTSGYLAEGLFPIVDQSQSFICGWTNDEDAVITNDLPLIVFGDHTCALKLLQRPFAQGADGIKILESKPSISIEFLYQALQVRPLTSDAYRRHFSLLQEKKVCFPVKETGEQEKIICFLSSLDDLIAAQTQKIEALKIHKKGLMQQLFPSPEEVAT